MRGNRSHLQLTRADHEVAIQHAFHIISRCNRACQRASNSLRREFTQVWVTRIAFISAEGDPVIENAGRTDWAEALHTATDTAPENEESGTYRYRITSTVHGSNVATLVGATGIEPATARV